MSYCASRYQTVRRSSTEVMVGDVGVGGSHPIRIQSMTTTDTQDVDATVEQCVGLAEAGCEIIRITAPNVSAARCLRDIRRKLQQRGVWEPLVADIHFLPSAAMEAVEHVEKVRINPGNYADRKKFQVLEYSDREYEEELDRIYEAFTPLVKRCQTLGRSMRIGTNHGSLSDRIMNRYGDTPLGMVESALEFLRIGASHGYDQMVLSMKASNPKVMIQAYRLLVERMAREDMHYPLHLGVTEAGDGEDGRIKSAIGIGSLLLDGLGDTIRVSLTEDPVYEVPVARMVADKAIALWEDPTERLGAEPDSIDPYSFQRRSVRSVDLGPKSRMGPDQPPRVITAAPEVWADPSAWGRAFGSARMRLQDTPPEGILVPLPPDAAGEALKPLADAIHAQGGFLVLDLGCAADGFDWPTLFRPGDDQTVILLGSFSGGQADELMRFLDRASQSGFKVGLQLDPDAVAHLATTLETSPATICFATAAPTRRTGSDRHQAGRYRQLAEALLQARLDFPLWIRTNDDAAIQPGDSFLSRLLEASILTGSLLCDGIGDLVSFEGEPELARSTVVAYNLLQGAGARISKTEFVACPSCGRTLFDLQTTTQRIRAQTGHLKGVKIAIMGCIVNGPGEMADADFGYVGGAPGKINLYAGKECVQYHIPADEADRRLVDLIKEHGKWTDPAQIADGGTE